MKNKTPKTTMQAFNELAEAHAQLLADIQKAVSANYVMGGAVAKVNEAMMALGDIMQSMKKPEEKPDFPKIVDFPRSPIDRHRDNIPRVANKKKNEGVNSADKNDNL